MLNKCKCGPICRRLCGGVLLAFGLATLHGEEQPLPAQAAGMALVGVMQPSTASTSSSMTIKLDGSLRIPNASMDAEHVAWFFDSTKLGTYRD